MDLVTLLAIVSTVISVAITIIVLAAVGSIRRNLNDGALKQAQQIRRLAETVGTLNGQLQAAETKIQILTEANRRLSEEMAALGERMADGDPARPAGSARMLH